MTITTVERLSLFGVEYPVEWRTGMVVGGDYWVQALIATEHGELVATSEAHWSALASLMLLVEWLNAEGERKAKEAQ